MKKYFYKPGRNICYIIDDIKQEERLRKLYEKKKKNPELRISDIENQEREKLNCEEYFG
jgi:hypothetical protein